MTVQEIKDWIVERDNMLEKRDVKALMTFMDKWAKKGVYSIRDTESFKRATPQVQLMTLCKMICNVPTLSKQTIVWARVQLKDLGAKPTIF